MMTWFLSLIIPVIFIVIGLVFYKHPPKEINCAAGWRTARAEKNQLTWDFANKLGGKCMLILGLAEFFCTVILLLLTFKLAEDITVVLVLIQAACMAFVYIYVEHELKKHFGED